MKLEDQVLSIEQVRELQELGFDIGKYSSMCWIGVEDKYRLTIFDTWCLEKTCLGTIPTLTIGDIIDILPTFIEIDSSKITHKLGINNSNIQYFNNNNIFIRFENNTQIYRLFQCLKWCIKEKHIAL